MNHWLVRFAASAVRAWTRAYTWRLPPAVAQARRTEIESDLWESQHDPLAASGAGLGLQMLVRLVLGVPDDLGWRAAYGATRAVRVRQAIAVTAAAVLLTIAWVLGEVIGPQRLPPVPETPLHFVYDRKPWGPPPPPLPPPSRPTPRR